MAKPWRIASLLQIVLTTLFVSSIASAGQPSSFDALADRYQGQIVPLLSHFCLDCHSTESKEGDLDLERFDTLAVIRRDPQAWQKVLEMVAQGEMPPEDSDPPDGDQREQLLGWLRDYLHAEGLANAGDPGPVVLRRLNNAEYTYTIRDLTGVELDPAREFPSAGAGGEGFTNVGNALAMSPSLLTKYLDASKAIAEHAVLLPDGFRFSTSTMQGDWTDEILAEIRGLYSEWTTTEALGVGTEVGNVNVHTNTRIGLMGRLPLEPYLATTLSERDAIQSGAKTLAAAALEHQLNTKYFDQLWSSLTSAEPSLVLDGLRRRWQDADSEDAAALVAEVAGWQKSLWTFGPVGLIGRKGGRSRWMEPIDPLVTQVEIHVGVPAEEAKETILELVVTDAGDGNEHDFVLFNQPRFVAEGMPDLLLRELLQPDPDAEETRTSLEAERAEWHHTPAVPLQASMFGTHPDGGKIDADSLCVHAPAIIQIRLPAAVAGREFRTTATLDPESGAAGSVQVLDVLRGVHHPPVIRSGLCTSELSVEFSQVTKIFSDHQSVIYRGAIVVGADSENRARVVTALDDYRQLFPAALCYTQIVPVDEVITVWAFYREDDHLSRLMLDQDQHARLDRSWNQLKYVTQSPLKDLDTMVLQLEVAIGDPQYDSLEALREPVRQRADAFRQELVDSEPGHLAALVDFAARAYRGKMSDVEANELQALYHQLRQQELSHEEAFRLTLARVFVASPYLYRLEDVPEGAAPAAVTDWELANRLSYFLWSSMPDAELRQAAEQGDLTANEEEITRHARRMLRDPRIRRLATEFACQYLHIYEFDPLVEKSEEHFPDFVAMRPDIYEESILFFSDLFQNDGSLLSMLNADHAFVNERLATFYGIDGIEGGQWRRLDGVRQHGRGGILALATTLAQQSGTTRTSPILRGNWVSEVLLGEKLPRPPKDVPQLSDSIPEGLTERQLIERHSSDASCAKCHERVDPIGFALENYDAIGRRRETDAGGLPIDARTTMPDGTEIEGLAGLRDYLLDTRRDAFVRQFCRKLLGYALGREVQLSDEPLLDDIMNQLAEQDYRFSVAVEAIVLSDQFRRKRAVDENP